MLSCWQVQDGCEAFWDPEHLDTHLTSRWCAGIASEALEPVEAIMRALGPRQGRSRARWVSRGTRPHLDLNALVTKKVQTHTPMVPTTPVTPKERRIPNDERMQEDAHLARLFRGAPLPLALLAQGTGTTIANAGRRDHAQPPSTSRRRSCEVSVFPAGQRSVPSGWRGKSCPVKRPLFRGGWLWSVDHIQTQARQRLDAWQLARSAVGWREQTR